MGLVTFSSNTSIGITSLNFVRSVSSWSVEEK